MDKQTPVILIIVGITGDLASRKLLPAIGELLSENLLPDNFVLIGITRKSDVDLEKLLAQTMHKDLVRKHLTLLQMEERDQSGYDRLGEKFRKIEDVFGKSAERLFYLSVPPQASEGIIEMLGTSGLSHVPNTKLLLEKPFGINTSSAVSLFENLEKNFSLSQVYLVDHYLTKEIASNILSARTDNSVFESKWNKNYVEKIEILASESIGIEGRTSFYEGMGALRDIVQNHLLELAALLLMNVDKIDSKSDIPLRRLESLKYLHLKADEDIKSVVLRGQYEGYKKEVGNPSSTIETFVSLTLASDDPRWQGVPIHLTTGKMLDRKAVEIRVHYRDDTTSEQLPFNNFENQEKSSKAYENVFLAALDSDQNLFTSKEEILESWRIVAPIQEAWKESSDDLFVYKEGTNPTF